MSEKSHEAKDTASEKNLCGSKPPVASVMTSVELITSWDRLEGVGADWDRLWPLSETCSKEFYSLQWISAVASKVASPGGHPWTVVLRENGEIVGIAPLFWQKTRHPRLRIPLRAVGFIPNDMQYRHGFLGKGNWERLLGLVINEMRVEGHIDVLTLTGLEESAARRLFAAAKAQGARCSLLQVNQARGGVPGTASVDMCAVDLEGTWEDFLRSRKAGYRENLRRHERLAEGDGTLHFWRHASGRQVSGESMPLSEMVENIEHVERDAWQTRRGVNMGTHGREHLENLLLIALRANALDLSFLFFNGEAVAFRAGFIAGRYARQCKSAYNEHYRRLAPGILLRARIIESSMKHTDLSWLELGGSRHTDKHDVADSRDSGFELTVYANTPRGALFYQCRRVLGKHHLFDEENDPKMPFRKEDTNGPVDTAGVMDGPRSTEARQVPQHSQVEQRPRIRAKYSCEEEFSFWREFADKGLLDFENRAVSAHVAAQSRVLDIGCGCGREALALATRGFDVCALDLVPRMARAARQRLLEARLCAGVVVADVTEDVPFREAFDAAVLFEQVYQHIPGRESRIQALRNIRACLAPEGKILISAFNEGDIDFVARLRWLLETKWLLAKSLILKGENPMNTRYLRTLATEDRALEPHTLHERLRLLRWTAAYSWGLLRRRARMKLAKFTCRDSDSLRCKPATKCNPCSNSDGWFWLRVLSYAELRRELEEAGLQVCDVFAFLESHTSLSPRAKRGAPLYCVVCMREDDEGER